MRFLAVSLTLFFSAASALADDGPKPVAAKEPELRLELLRRVKADQDARLAMVAWSKEQGFAAGVNEATLTAELKAEYETLRAAVRQADLENTERLGAIVKQHGWPGNSLVGSDGSHAALLLVQHADRNVPLQRKCLDLMVKLPKDEVSQRDVAYLTDRVLLHEGKQQIYGTQMMSADGKWVPQPLEDAANVDRRRAEAGMEPLAEYIKLVESFYGNAGTK